MRHRLALIPIVTALTLGGGCATAYKSFYRETNASQRAPVPAANVKVVKSATDLKQSWIEIGQYNGHAPTVQEAMQAAQTQCGKAGADFFILYTEPYAAGGVWKLDGFCAASSTG